VHLYLAKEALKSKVHFSGIWYIELNSRVKVFHCNVHIVYEKSLISVGDDAFNYVSTYTL